MKLWLLHFSYDNSSFCVRSCTVWKATLQINSCKYFLVFGVCFWNKTQPLNCLKGIKMKHSRCSVSFVDSWRMLYELNPFGSKLQGAKYQVSNKTWHLNSAVTPKRSRIRWNPKQQLADLLCNDLLTHNRSLIKCFKCIASSLKKYMWQ